MTDLEQILARCKCGVYFTANEHRDYHQSAEEWLNEYGEHGTRAQDHEVTPEVLAEMVATDTVYVLQFYPNTPNGFHMLMDSNVERLLQRAIAQLNADEVKKDKT